jgi:hypothetical protein
MAGSDKPTVERQQTDSDRSQSARVLNAPCGALPSSGRSI